MNSPSPVQSPPTALEKRERRPTATVLFLAALFALPMGTCGGIGAWKATDIGRPVIPTSAAELAATRDGAYVSFDAPLRHVATDEIPLDDHTAAVATGTSLYAIEGAPGVYVAAKKGTLAPGAAAAGAGAAGVRFHVEGRVCSGDSHLVCTVDNEGVRIFLRSEDRRASGITKRGARGGRDTSGTTKLVTFGAAPSENIGEAVTGLGIAGALGVVLLAVGIVIVRGRRKPFLFVERVVPLRQELDLLRLGHALGPAFRPAHATPDACTFLTGASASRAQAVGAFNAHDYPQRVEIWRDAGAGGYRQAQARVRVSEIFAQPAGPIPQILPSLQATLETTLARVAHALSVP